MSAIASHQESRLESVRSRGTTLACAALAIFVVALHCAAHASEIATPAGVLIVHSNQRPLPAGIVIEDTLRKVVLETLGSPVEFYSEYLDVERFSAATYADAEAEYLRQKYSVRNIRVVVASAPQALQFAIAFRDRMLVGVPVVHIAVPRDQLEGMALPPGTVGKTVDLDPTATLQLALRLHPDAKHLVIVVGATERDRIWEQRVHAAVGRLEGRLEVEYLSGLPTADVLRRLGALTKNTIVYTPGYFADGAGHLGTPRQSLELMGPASAAPVYGPLDTFLGTGVVGGYLAPYEDQAKEAAAIVVRLLNGAAPTEIAPSSVPNVPVVDWRQIRRWGIDERLLPAETVVRFREPSVFVRYQWQIIAIVIALALQSLLIASLLFERRRRRVAEIESRQRFSEMTHMNRSVALGELSASVAHEINQPLGAILNNANAAQMLLKSNPPALKEVADILDDIKRDDVRAGEVITRIRGLLRKTEFELRDVALNALVEETLKFIIAEASVKGVSLRTELAAGLPPVRADDVQIEQVILNLALNAMDAMHAIPAATRKMTIRTARANEAEAEVSVADSGAGISPDSLPRIFEPFFTTKREGMGLGLSISRTIVEAHGGRIWAENAQGGAVFRFTLPFSTTPPA